MHHAMNILHIHTYILVNHFLYSPSLSKSSNIVGIKINSLKLYYLLIGGNFRLYIGESLPSSINCRKFR